MILYEEARESVVDHATKLGTETLRLNRLLGRYLAEPIIAQTDIPLFDNSAVDGFGVRLQDVANASENNPAKLSFAGTISAGDPGDISFSQGETIKILTGATVPHDVEAVVMREFCEEQNGHVLVKQPAQASENIRRRGDEFAHGQTVLHPGTRITPAVLGLIATLGYERATVFRKPRVAVMVTGNELLSPGMELTPGKIYDSNSYALRAALVSHGVEKVSVLHTSDELESTKATIQQALAKSDIVITTGGVSVGDFDFVKDACEQLGFQTIFWKIALKPGKPVYFGKLGNKLIFGLPGNPVSVLVTFHQLVKPALLKMMGAESTNTKLIPARLAKPLKKKAGRMEFVRGVVKTEDNQLVVHPTIGQDSHMLGGLAQANCLIYFAKDSETLQAGDQVQVELLEWSAN